MTNRSRNNANTFFKYTYIIFFIFSQCVSISIPIFVCKIKIKTKPQKFVEHGVITPSIPY